MLFSHFFGQQDTQLIFHKACITHTTKLVLHIQQSLYYTYNKACITHTTKLVLHIQQSLYYTYNKACITHTTKLVLHIQQSLYYTYNIVWPIHRETQLFSNCHLMIDFRNCRENVHREAYMSGLYQSGKLVSKTRFLF